MREPEAVSAPSPRDPTDDTAQRTVWVESTRYHKYRGKVKQEGAMYLIRPDEVENHETLGVARRIPPPRIAQRTPRS
jgi:hypothetical protein